MTQSGWRKPSPKLGIAEQYAQAGKWLAVPKSRTFVAVKRIGAHIGLKAGDMLLLDTLGAFTQAQDWDVGQRPIVWASNAYLMEQTGFSLSALKRHARRLAEIGVISFKDSPNGKRWGRRDADGSIIEAYGFDLSPLSARVEEFEQLQAELLAERELCQRLRRQITVARRTIRAWIQAAYSGSLRGPWEHLSGLLENLLDCLPLRKASSETLEPLLTRFKELQERVKAAYVKAFRVNEINENTPEISELVSVKLQELNPKEIGSDPHILTTTQLINVSSNQLENEQTAGVMINRQPNEKVERKLVDCVIETRKARGIALDLPTVMQACPEFASWARNLSGYLKDWIDLNRVAGQLRPMIGVSDHAWNLAQDRLGPQIASAALVLTFDKHCCGEVTSPSGYLRGIVQKAEVGELHLERSFYGRLRGQS